MKRVIKGKEPPALTAWKAENHDSPQNLVYGNLPGKVLDNIKEQMLKEQGYLCGYTMRRLNAVTECHLEHIEPQNASTRDLDYANMLACFPSDGGDTKPGYGAPIKGGVAVNSDNFVSPIHPQVEQHFHYTWKGEIYAKNPQDVAAAKTIKLLKLDNPKLADLRKAAIEAAGITRASDMPLSAAKARRLAQECLQKDANSHLPAYCPAISQVAEEYALREEKRATRLRGKARN